MLSTQLDLFAALEAAPVADAEPPTWTYHYGLPDRSGAAQYTHIIRWRHDPKETRGRGFSEGRAKRPRGTGWIAKEGDAEHWAARILDLLSDGRPRTWHCIAVHLTGLSGDVLQSTAEDGLWLAVERGDLVWACEEGCVWFLRAADLYPEAIAC